MENVKNKKFNDLVFDRLSSLEKFDKIQYEFNRIRNIMIEDSPEFNLLPIKKQFHQCFSIWRMIIISKRSIIRQVSIFNKNVDEDIKKYDPEYGFEEPEYVEINGIKMLSI